MYDVLPTLTDTVIGITSGTVIPDVTETLNDIAALFNFASLAVHVTIVVPIGKNDSDGGSQTGPDVTLTLSVTVGSLYATFAPFAVVAFTVILSSTLKVGG